MIYFDSSALVKRYLREGGSESVNAILLSEKVIVTSKLAYPEIPSLCH
jgi:predicted nucleic acid-binding protein